MVCCRLLYDSLHEGGISAVDEPRGHSVPGLQAQRFAHKPRCQQGQHPAGFECCTFMLGINSEIIIIATHICISASHVNCNSAQKNKKKKNFGLQLGFEKHILYVVGRGGLWSRQHVPPTPPHSLLASRIKFMMKSSTAIRWENCTPETYSVLQLWLSLPAEV